MPSDEPELNVTSEPVRFRRLLMLPLVQPLGAATLSKAWTPRTAPLATVAFLPPRILAKAAVVVASNEP